MKIAKPALYERVASKEALLAQRVGAAPSDIAKAVEAAIARMAINSTRLDGLTDALTAAIALTFAALAIYVANVTRLDPLARVQLLLARRRAETALQTFIREGQTKGVFDAPDPAAAIAPTMSWIDWTRIGARPAGSSVSEADLRDLICRLFGDGKTKAAPRAKCHA